MPRVRRVGNSLTVTLPSVAALALGLKPGDEVDVQVCGNHLEVVPVVRRPRLRPSLQAGVDFMIEHYGEDLERLAK